MTNRRDGTATEPSTGNPTGRWSEAIVAGHACSVYEPARLHPHGFSLIYLHGVHQQGLDDRPAFLRQFDRHGLRVICPRTARSWWTDKVCAEFDPQVTAERFVPQHV